MTFRYSIVMLSTSRYTSIGDTVPENVRIHGLACRPIVRTRRIGGYGDRLRRHQAPHRSVIDDLSGMVDRAPAE